MAFQLFGIPKSKSTFSLSNRADRDVAPLSSIQLESRAWIDLSVKGPKVGVKQVESKVGDTVSKLNPKLEIQ